MKKSEARVEAGRRRDRERETLKKLSSYEENLLSQVLIFPF